MNGWQIATIILAVIVFVMVRKLVDDYNMIEEIKAKYEIVERYQRTFERMYNSEQDKNTKHFNEICRLRRKNRKLKAKIKKLKGVENEEQNEGKSGDHGKE